MSDNIANSNAIEERKKVERDWYNRIYQNNEDFSSSLIREDLLSDSEELFKRRVLDLCTSGKKVLEIGSGTGQHAVLAAKNGANVLGIDISREGVKKATELVKQFGLQDKCNFIIGDCEKLLFERDEFDVIIDHETLSSVLPSAALNECIRVLKPGGVILGIECLGHNPIFNLNRKLKSRKGGRTHWATAHILKINDLDRIRPTVNEVKVSYHHLVAVYAGPILIRLPKIFYKILKKPLILFDRLLCATVFSRYCFKVIFEIVK